jgi:hypothetical protein
MSSSVGLVLDAVERSCIARLVSTFGACALCATATVNAAAGLHAAHFLSVPELHEELSLARSAAVIVDHEKIGGDDDRDDNDAAAAAGGDVQKANSSVAAAESSTAPLPICTVCYGLFQRDEAFWQRLLAASSAHLRGLPQVESWLICALPSTALWVRAHLMTHLMQPKCQGVRLRAFDLKAIIRHRIMRSVLLQAQRAVTHVTTVTPSIECRVRVDHADGLPLANRVACANGGANFPKPQKHNKKRRKFAAIDERNEFFNTDEPSMTKLAPCLLDLGARIVDVFENKIPAAPAAAARVSLDFVHDSIWIGGRYNKWVRGVSQSPWIIGTTMVTEHSVETVIAQPLRALFGNSTHAFRAAGREDKDVRMLGDGRPFLIEVVQPRVLDVTVGELAALGAAINAQFPNIVTIRDLTLVDKSAAAAMNTVVEQHRKGYRALVQTSAAPSAELVAQANRLVDLAVSQRTPIRVAHRRSNITRVKTIHSLSLRAIHSNWFELQLTTSSGTYIKEFVHGDLGRTTPSLASLLGVDWADISQLDVTDVFMPFPLPEHCKLPVSMPPPPPPADLPLFTMPCDADDVGECD